jgi:hypothetical protein
LTQVRLKTFHGKKQCK